ncbi:MAG: thiol-disulfide oxidoreductase DCC family protein [Ignavibacteria bacterium]|nr:thiol-disulfide oxidoreductase DCC family protein [Ignavibacteria bacterium]
MLPDNKIHGIVLFDGVCNFCNSSVNLIIKHDKNDYFRFASLQSEFGRNCLKKFNLPEDNLSTLILVEGSKHYLRSSGALRIAKQLSYPINLSFALIIIPPFIRNFLYTIIANNRYKWFGKRETCRIPTPEEREKFMD